MIPKPIDTDGDGIVDSLDKCPTVIGVVRYQGCPPPDRDGDKINDDDDSCPDIKGVAEYKGCPEPDADDDGIADKKDKCPTQAGTAANGGCPDIQDSVRSMFSKAARQVFFKTGSYVLVPSSYTALNEVVQVLKKNPAIQLQIEGHTDNTGAAAKNQLLSENRARAVLLYLQKEGIDVSRLHAVGYGAQRPVADNGTVAGRAANRRVVFEVRY
jgi:OOP family OmpA-OmpF porin